MASRRLILASSLRIRGSSWRTPQVFSCISGDHFKQRQQQQQLPPTPLPFATPLALQIRSFSASVNDDNKQQQDDSSYRERAKQARERMSVNAAKTSKAARKGAQTAKEMLQQYGPVFVGTYMSVYFLTWGSLFVGIDSGLLDPVSLLSWMGGSASEGKSTVHVVVELLEKYSWTAPYAETVEQNPHLGNLAVAWVTTKFTEPIRLGVTLGIVPKLARHFGFVHATAEQHESSSDENENDIVEKKKEEDKKTRGP